MEFRYAKWKQVLFCLLYLAIEYLCYLGAKSSDPIYIFVSWTVLGLFFIALILIIIQIFDFRVQFRIDENGIWDVRYPDAPIAWDQITFITIRTFQFQKRFNVYFKNLDAFLERVPHNKWWLLRFNKRSGFGAISLPILIYDHPAKDAIEYIRTIHPEKLI